MALKHDNDEHTGCCDGGCPICIEQPPSYVHGYADGKGKAHFEIRYMRANHNPRVCGCEPCVTVRVVLARFGLWPDALEAADAADHPDYPGYKFCRGCQGPDDGHFPDCIVQLHEKRMEATSEEAQRTARRVSDNALMVGDMTPEKAV